MSEQSPFDPESAQSAATGSPRIVTAGEGAPAQQPPSAYGYGSNVLGATEVHLLDYVKVLYRRRSRSTSTG